MEEVSGREETDIIGTFMFTFKVTLTTYFHQYPNGKKKNKIHFGIAKFLEFECSNNLVLIKWKSEYVALHHCVR